MPIYQSIAIGYLYKLACSYVQPTSCSTDQVTNQLTMPRKPQIRCTHNHPCKQIHARLYPHVHPSACRHVGMFGAIGHIKIDIHLYVFIYICVCAEI